MTDDENRDSALIPSSRALPAKISLVKRGIDLASIVNTESRSADTESREAEAQKYLHWAWIDFPQGCTHARKHQTLGYLIDTFDWAVQAAALWLGVDRDDDQRAVDLAKEVIRRTAVTASNPIFGRDTERLIARMERLKNEGDERERAYRQLANEGREELIVELAAFVDAVGSRIDPARATLRQRAMAGDVYAQYCFGWWCDVGCGMPQDSEQSAYWWRQAAEQGHAAAQFTLAMTLDLGMDEPKRQDTEQAVYWYRKAAEQGHADAQCSLGSFCRDGHGVPQDFEQAVLWFRRAAEQGSWFGQWKLGSLYCDGRGVSLDRVEAYKWLHLAATRDSFAAQERDAVANQMTPDEVAEAQKRAHAWTEAFKQRRQK